MVPMNATKRTTLLILALLSLVPGSAPVVSADLPDTDRAAPAACSGGDLSPHHAWAYAPLGLGVAAGDIRRSEGPGVPDIYQGSEALNFSLVDPDNRRDPDFATLERMLDDERPNFSAEENWLSGQVKQRVIAHVLRLRHLAAVDDWLAELERVHGPIQPETLEWAAQLVERWESSTTQPRRRSRRG